MNTSHTVQVRDIKRPKGRKGEKRKLRGGRGRHNKKEGMTIKGRNGREEGKNGRKSARKKRRRKEEGRRKGN